VQWLYLNSNINTNSIISENKIAQHKPAALVTQLNIIYDTATIKHAFIRQQK